MSIGSTIKRLRREKDITQEQLAEYLGITSRGGWIMEAEGNRSQMMLDWLLNDDDDQAKVLRSSPRYEPLISRLKETARKP